MGSVSYSEDIYPMIFIWEESCVIDTPSGIIIDIKGRACFESDLFVQT